MEIFVGVFSNSPLPKIQIYNGNKSVIFTSLVCREMKRNECEVGNIVEKGCHCDYSVRASSLGGVCLSVTTTYSSLVTW